MPLPEKYQHIARRAGLLMRYCIAGGCGAVVDLGVLFILKHFAGMNYIPASIIAFLCAVSVSFSMQKYWAFKDRSNKKIKAQFPIFASIGLINIAVNTFLLYVLVSYVHVWYLLGQVIASLIIALYSFFIYRYGIFGKKTEKQATFRTSQEN